MAADTLDLITLDEAQDAIGRDGDTLNSDNTGRLEAIVTAVSRWVDFQCGAMVNRTVTSESHDGGCTLIETRVKPVASVTAITEYNNTAATTLTAETNATKLSSNFVVTQEGLIARRSGNAFYYFPCGVQNVLVTYVAGRVATTALVERDVKEAAKIIVRHVHGAEHGAGSVTYGPDVLPPGFAVPNRALELLARYRQHPNLLVG